MNVLHDLSLADASVKPTELTLISSCNCPYQYEQQTSVDISLHQLGASRLEVPAEPALVRPVTM